MDKEKEQGAHWAATGEPLPRVAHGMCAFQPAKASSILHERFTSVQTDSSLAMTGHVDFAIRLQHAGRHYGVRPCAE